MSSNNDPRDLPTALEDERVRDVLLARMFGIATKRTNVGRFRLHEQMGRGAMGTVYAAHDPRLDRRVALKLLHGGANARVLAEARAMAAVDHPNVASVFEAGVVDERVFIAMEFVEGQTLRRWCSERGRSWRAVLAAFRQAGAGLAAAHRAGMVHRDFKPDNVLVGTDGRVRVVDFGLARPIAPAELGDGDLVLAADPDANDPTLTGSIAGTPAYMAPELFRGEPASPQSDQFAFCVALVEGLFGGLPFRGGSVAELVARARAGDIDARIDWAPLPASMRRAIRRGLSLEPDGRHPSMDTLLDALDPGRTRRPRLAIGITGAAALLFAAAAFGRSGEDPISCSPATDRFEGLWDDASRDALHAAVLAPSRPYVEDTWDRVKRAFDDYRDAWLEAHVDACEAARDGGQSNDPLLDGRMRCLHERLRRLRAAIDTLREADTSVVDHALDLVAALPSVDACAEPALTLADPPLPEGRRASEVEAVGDQVARARAMEAAGKLERAAAIAEKALKSAQEIGYLPLLAEAEHALGSAELARGRVDAAEQLLRNGYFDAREIRVRDTAARAAADLAILLAVERTQFDEALDWARFAEGEAQARGDPALLATALNARGIAQAQRGAFEPAAAAFEEAIAHREAVAGADDLHALTIRANLARVLRLMDRYDAALQQAQNARQGLERAVGSYHPRVVEAVHTVARLLIVQRRHAEARGQLVEARDLAIASLGETHPTTIRMRTTLGQCLRLTGELEAARDELERAVAAADASVGENPTSHLGALEELAAVHSELGQPHRALEYLQRSAAASATQLGADHPDHAVALAQVADALVETGETNEALHHIDRSIEIFEANAGAGGANLGMALLIRAEALRASGRIDSARADLERSLAIREALFGSDSARLWQVLVPLAEVHLTKGRLADALTVAERALLAASRDEAAQAHERALAELVTAKSRWASGVDRPSAAALARSAAAALRAGPPASQANAAEAEAWARAHAGPG